MRATTALEETPQYDAVANDENIGFGDISYHSVRPPCEMYE
jgi:hypothetical protein